MWDASRTADVAVVGCGPAGLALAAEIARHGRSVVLIGSPLPPRRPPHSVSPGEDVPFVNNYGVWVDEFESIGMAEALERIWPEAVCYFGEEQEVSPLRSSVHFVPSHVTCCAVR